MLSLEGVGGFSSLTFYEFLILSFSSLIKSVVVFAFIFRWRHECVANQSSAMSAVNILRFAGNNGENSRMWCIVVVKREAQKLSIQFSKRVSSSACSRFHTLFRCLSSLLSVPSHVLAAAPHSALFSSENSSSQLLHMIYSQTKATRIVSQCLRSGNEEMFSRTWSGRQRERGKKVCWKRGECCVWEKWCCWSEIPQKKIVTESSLCRIYMKSWEAFYFHHQSQFRITKTKHSNDENLRHVRTNYRMYSAEGLDRVFVSWTCDEGLRWEMSELDCEGGQLTFMSYTAQMDYIIPYSDRTRNSKVSKYLSIERCSSETTMTRHHDNKLIHFDKILNKHSTFKGH